MSVPVIAIDGPSASGKGTLARRVAEALGFHYLESGALYRLIGLAGQRAGIAPGDEGALARLAASLEVEFPQGGVRLAGREVTGELRTEECGRLASAVAKLPAVRAALLERQRAFRQPPGLVADGRDMGTVVFPEARLKVFLTALPAARAARRLRQLQAEGQSAELAVLTRELEARDHADAARAHAPLRPAADARMLDSTRLSIDEVVALVLRWYRETPPAGAKGRA